MAVNPAFVAAIAQGGASLGGTIISSINARNENRWARDWNEEQYRLQEENEWKKWYAQNEYDQMMWNKQNEYNEQLWHKMNAYNSPMAQMQRYKEAGLNPNLIYGSSNTTSPIATANFGSNNIGKGSLGNTTGAPNSYGEIGEAFSQGLGAYLNFREASARTNNLEAQNKVLEQEIVGRALDNIGKGTKNQADQINLSNLKNYSADAAEAALRQTQAVTAATTDANRRANQLQNLTIADLKESINAKRSTIKTQEQERALRDIDQQIKTIELNIRKNGGNPNDPAYMKYIILMLAPALQKIGDFFGMDMSFGTR